MSNTVEQRPGIPENADEVVTVDGVPHIKGPHQFWCGYTDLAMLLQHVGYDFTPEAVFSHIHGVPYVEERERYRGRILRTEEDQGEIPLHADIQSLALAVKELTGEAFVARLVDTDMYGKINAARRADGKDELTPVDILQTKLRGGTPCMVRKPGHFFVVAGFYRLGNETRYLTHNSLNQNPLWRPARELESEWATRELFYPSREKPMDTRNLMLFLVPNGARRRTKRS